MIEWLERLDQELDNLRVALEWSLTSNVERGLQIMTELVWFWWISGLFNEGAEWLDKLLKAEVGRARRRAPGKRAGLAACPRAAGDMLYVKRYL